MVTTVADTDYVDGDGNVKIADFGFSVSYSSKALRSHVNTVSIDV